MEHRHAEDGDICSLQEDEVGDRQPYGHSAQINEWPCAVDVDVVAPESGRTEHNAQSDEE